MADDVELVALLSALEEQPTDLDRAWRYWRGLDNWQGCDIRSGAFVVRAFCAAALAGPRGAAALAAAYSELHALSGESPRLFFADRELRSALSRSLAGLTDQDRRRVEWVLGCVTGSGSDRPRLRL